ncbi:MAG: helix-turn-helix domain-containing protein [Planctomycetales bacterium]|nr:helix-turn-helix domain-containing protein [Planctomycetales bacterium]
MTDALLQAIEWPSPSLGAVLLLHRPDVETLTVLSGCFRVVLFSLNDGFLTPEELGEVLVSDNRRNLFIGGTVNHNSKTITLWRGSLSSITVPFCAFEPSGNGTKPDFSKFSVADYGHTIKLGDYEAAADAVLYEFDPEFRREQGRQRRASEKSFGASLRRLRKQRGLSRNDFQPLSMKTIARIEQGKVGQVHGRTLVIIAKTLGVDRNEIENY